MPHEERDIHVAGVAWSAAGLALFLILVALMPLALIPALGSMHRRVEPRVEQFKMPPLPRLEANGIQDLADIRAGELKRLNSDGPDHIAITKAMRIVAQRGVPVRGSR